MENEIQMEVLPQQKSIVKQKMSNLRKISYFFLFTTVVTVVLLFLGVVFQMQSDQKTLTELTLRSMTHVSALENRVKALEHIE